MSTAVTDPVAPTMRASSAALYPVPAPISRTRSPGRAASCSSMIAIIDGWDAELVATPSTRCTATASSA
jgi:hypothetical protein